MGVIYTPRNSPIWVYTHTHNLHLMEWFKLDLPMIPQFRGLNYGVNPGIPGIHKGGSYMVF